ncbi:hypothetical protein Q3G72_005541 [Acer saccharum]|nr:hypothetical protein Q3G72_005541 [Acer saccharum]
MESKNLLNAASIFRVRAVSTVVGISLTVLVWKLPESRIFAVEYSTIESNARLEHAMTQIVDGSTFQLMELP